MTTLSGPIGAGVGAAGRNLPKSQQQTTVDTSTYQWVIGWTVFIAILAVLAQTEIGYRIVYYVLVLVLVLLIVTQGQAIATTLAPVGTQIPAQAVPSA